VRSLIEARSAEVAVCNLDARVDADLVAVDALARLQLQARRLGCSVQLGVAPRAVDELLELVGLADVFLGLETSRQAEQREELLGVEEEREFTDPPS
jgi:ABC-type transporter Mla MlaB component